MPELFPSADPSAPFPSAASSNLSEHPRVLPEAEYRALVDEMKWTAKDFARPTIETPRAEIAGAARHVLNT